MDDIGNFKISLRLNIYKKSSRKFGKCSLLR
jgi:hypothetical protein